MSFTEIARTVGDAWQSLPPSEKESYENQASRAKQKYIAELAEYKKTDDYRRYSEYLADFKTKQGVLQHHVQSSSAPIIAHQDWREGHWYSGPPASRGKLEAVSLYEDTTSVSQNSGNVCDHWPFKAEALDDSDVDMSGCNRTTLPSTSSSHPSIRLYSRPPTTRSYGSSSGSSASTLMTPRDALSWVGSTYSPSLFETNDSISNSSSFQSNHFASKFTKDLMFGDFPTNSEFRFSSIPAGSSPESTDPEWFLEDYAEQEYLPIYSSHNDTELRRPKRSREISKDRDSKRLTKSVKSSEIPGLGIISKDGMYKEGTNPPSKSRARHGPLSQEQAEHARLMRRHGACKQCRKRKVKVSVSALYFVSERIENSSTPV